MGRLAGVLVALSYGLSLATGCDAFDNAALSRLKAELADAGSVTTDSGTRDAGMDGGRDSGQTGMDAGADAGHDAGPGPQSCNSGSCWWSTTDPDGCQSAGRPTLDDRPESDDDRELRPFYVGLSRMRLGAFLPDGTFAEDAWATFGLDLDGTCTNSITCPDAVDEVSCQPTVPAIAYDGELCRDNTFARLQPVAADVPQIGETFGLSEEVFNCALWRGDYTVITKISGYNGRPNDDQVRVDFYTSIGIQRERGWDCPIANFDELYPLWLSSERWFVDEAVLTTPIETPGELPDSIVATTDAYVRDGYVVALLPPDMPFRTAGDRALYPGFLLTIQQGVWAGHLVQDQSSEWRVRDGVLAGVLRTDDLINSFRQVGLCPGRGLDEFYDSVVTYITENADTLSDGRKDPEAYCNAMSVGIWFEADPLTPGQAVEVSELVDCPPPPRPIDIDGGQ